jgi:hypothetical protein
MRTESPPQQGPPPQLQPYSSLALRPKEAAKALGIGQRKLWELTAPRGPIPCVRVGCCVLYPYHLLQAWLAEQAEKETKS